MIIGITTAPRPNGVSYLKQTIESLRAAGGDQIIVFAEPGSDMSAVASLGYKSTLKDTIWQNPVVWYIPEENRLGNYTNWIRASRSMLRWPRERNESYILMCEDDVQFSQNSLAEAEATITSLQAEHGESTGPLLVYTSSVYQDRMEPGIKIIDSRSLCGSCAMLWPVAALKRVVECDRAKNWRGISGQDSGAEIHHSDTAIGLCCDDLGLRVFAASHCWAQHIGVVSSLHQFGDNRDMFASHVKE